MKIKELILYEASQLSDAFKHARTQGRGTPQSISDFREIALSRFLKRYFPYPYEVKKGNITDSYGDQSQSIDCLILNPMHPKTTTLDESTYDLIIADATDYAVELKPTLARSDEFDRLIDQSKSVKSLRRAHSPTFDFQLKKRAPSTSGYIAEIAREVPFFVFSEDIFPNERLVDAIRGHLEAGLSPHMLPDFFIHHQHSVVVNMRHPGYPIGIDDVGLFRIEFGQDTLLRFLQFLNQCYGSVISISKIPISYYFPKLEKTKGSKLIAYEFSELLETQSTCIEK